MNRSVLQSTMLCLFLLASWMFIRRGSRWRSQCPFQQALTGCAGTVCSCSCTLYCFWPCWLAMYLAMSCAKARCSRSGPSAGRFTPLALNPILPRPRWTNPHRSQPPNNFYSLQNTQENTVPKNNPYARHTKITSETPLAGRAKSYDQIAIETSHPKRSRRALTESFAELGAAENVFLRMVPVCSVTKYFQSS